MYGLTSEEIDKINEIFSCHMEIDKAVLYGSRAKGNYQDSSDIDLTLFGDKTTLTRLFEIENQLDDLLLPYKIDLSLHQKIENPDLIEHINRVGIVFYEKEKDVWKESVLGEFIDLISGYAFKSLDFQNIPTQNALPVIKIKNVANGDVNLNSVVYHNYSNSWEKFRLSKGDVLIAMTGNHPSAMTQVVGDVSKYKLEVYALLNQRVGKILARDNANLDFIYYLLKNDDVRNYLANKSSGSANQANISKGDILGLSLAIPSLRTQTAIASILSSLDDKIDLLHRQNATLEKMAETLFRQWFVEEAKEEWEVCKIGDFVLTNANTINKDYAYSEIQYLDTSSLNEGLITNLQLLNLREAPSRAKRLIKNNDILLSTVRPDQLHYGIIKEPPENLVVSTGFCVITCYKISPHFIYILLTNDEMTEFLHSIAEGSTSTYPSLKPSDVEKIEFKLPPTQILEKFEETTSQFFEKIKTNQNQILTLTALRDNLLPKLMSGEVKVSP